MMLRIEPVTDNKIWEAFLLSRAPSALFQSWSWGEVLKKQGKTVWRCGLYQGNKLLGVFQVVKVTARRGSFLHIRHGPILVSQSSALWKEVIEFFKHMASTEHVWFIRINPLISVSEENNKFLKSFGFIPSAIHAMDGEHCWLLDLTASEDELLMGMRKTTRYEIVRAQKLGVSIEKSENPHDLVYFHKLYEMTAERHGFIPHSGIDEEFEIFVKEKMALLFLGRHEGKVLASAIILFYGGQAIYHHSASMPTNIGVNYFLQWEAIREAKKRGMKAYNFWGIAPDDKPNHPWIGLSLFKKGFGGHAVDYIHAHDLPLSAFYVLSRLVEIIHRVKKGY